MSSLKELVKNSITDFPDCPVMNLCDQLGDIDLSGPIDEEKALMLLENIKRHEDEVRRFRQRAERILLDYTVSQYKLK